MDPVTGTPAPRRAVDLESAILLGRDLVASIRASLKLPASRHAGGPGSGNFGHAGRPGEVGGSAPSGESSAPASEVSSGSGAAALPSVVTQLSAAEMQALPPPSTVAEADAMVRGQYNEHAVIFRDGQTEVVLGDDDSNQVTLPMTMDLAGATLIHNHPTGGSFSVQDAITAVERRLSEIRAVTTSGTYVLRRVGQWPRGLVDELIRASGVVRLMFQAQINAGKLTEADANRRHYDETYARATAVLHAQGDAVDYHFEPRAA